MSDCNNPNCEDGSIPDAPGRLGMKYKPCPTCNPPKSDGPYTYGSNSGHIDRYEVFDPLGYNATGEFHDEEKARRLCESFNEVWHSRDQELASKDARIKELEAQVKELEVRLCSTAVMLNRKRIGYE